MQYIDMVELQTDSVVYKLHWRYALYWHDWTLDRLSSLYTTLALCTDIDKIDKSDRLSSL